MKSNEKSGSLPVRSTAQLAKHLGVSRWTVSRVLNGHKDVHPETAARIVAAARELGFAPNLLAQGLRSGRTKVVGVIVPGLEAFNLTAKIERLQQSLDQSGFQMLVSLAQDREEDRHQALRQFLSLKVAGVITFAADWAEGDPWPEVLRREGVPVVHVDPRKVGYGQVIRTDREAAMKDILALLVEKGHRHIWSVGISGQTAYGRQRIEGLKLGCKALGLEWGRDFRVLDGKDADCTDFQVGERMAGQVVKAGHRPTAVIALNDEVALGLIYGLRSLGVSVPEALSVVGYDNLDFSLYSWPSLTTVDPQVEKLMDRAVRCLQEKDDGRRKKEIRIRPDLIERKSVAKAGGAVSKRTKEKQR